MGVPSDHVRNRIPKMALRVFCEILSLSTPELITTNSALHSNTEVKRLRLNRTRQIILLLIKDNSLKRVFTMNSLQSALTTRKGLAKLFI